VFVQRLVSCVLSQVTVISDVFCCYTVNLQKAKKLYFVLALSK